MTLEQLRIFIAVAEQGHVTRAAGILCLTPSAVSASIRNLEERYGTELFERIGRGIVVSAAGRHFLPEARATLASARAAALTLAELGTGKRGVLTIEASQTIASYWLPRLLVKFRTAYPLVEIRLTVGNTRNVAQAVIDGSTDIGFVEDHIDDAAVTSEVVAADHFVAVVAPGHPWADGVPVSLAALVKADWVMREAGSGTRSAFEQMLAQLGMDGSSLAVALTMPSNESVRAAVIAGPFVTVVSTLVVAAELHAGILKKVNIDFPARAFYLLRHGARHKSRTSLALERLILAQTAAS